MLAEVAVPDQGAAKKMRPGHCTKKPPSPAGKLLDRRRLFFQAVPP